MLDLCKVCLPVEGGMWQHEGYFLVLKQRTCAVTNDLIRSIYPYENENNRNRAMQLVKSGSMQFSTLKFTGIGSSIDNNLKITLLKMNIAPSMKTKVKNETRKSNPDECD